jgi:hypothetical protein
MTYSTSEPREQAGNGQAWVETHPLETALKALEEGLFELAGILDAELDAALTGDSQKLEAAYGRKLALADSLEQRHAAVRSALDMTDADLLPALLTDVRKAALEAADRTLRAALMRNEAGLRAATEAVRRIFEAAARALAAEDIGYGPGRLQGDARFFTARTV